MYIMSTSSGLSANDKGFRIQFLYTSASSVTVTTQAIKVNTFGTPTFDTDTTDVEMTVDTELSGVYDTKTYSAVISVNAKSANDFWWKWTKNQEVEYYV